MTNSATNATLFLENNMLSTFTSQKFRFWSFISMVLLVFVHGYNLEIRYLQPWTSPNEAMTATGSSNTSVTSSVFCAVIAVMTDMAKTPLADMDLMSA